MEKWIKPAADFDKANKIDKLIKRRLKGKLTVPRLKGDLSADTCVEGQQDRTQTDT